MALYTVVYKSSCTGGEHIKLTVYRDGIELRDFNVTRTDIMTNELTWEQALPFLLRECIKRSGATTLAQARTAIEAASWEF